MDIHDISRSCKTFGVKNYFIVTPLERQKELVSKILGHWDSERASDYNPDRQDALSDTRVLSSVEDCIERISQECGKKPVVVATGANFKNYLGAEGSLRDKFSSIDNPPCLLLFGTGWGLHSDLDKLIDYKLEPII